MECIYVTWVTYANLIKHNIILFGMFSNIAKHQIALTEQIGRASCRERVCQYV